MQGLAHLAVAQCGHNGEGGAEADQYIDRVGEMEHLKFCHGPNDKAVEQIDGQRAPPNGADAGNVPVRHQGQQGENPAEGEQREQQAHLRAKMALCIGEGTVEHF